MDLTKSTEPKSDQQNFDDYVAGPKRVTITEVKSGTPDQPVEVHLAEFPGRPFKPSKSMRRVLVAAWGPKADDYAGRQMILFGDPDVMFGRQKVGGIRISHLSHIPEPLTAHLTVTRGKRAPFVVLPIGGDETVESLSKILIAATTVADLQAAWHRVRAAGMAKDTALVELKDARKAAIAEPESDPAAPIEGEPV